MENKTIEKEEVIKESFKLISLAGDAYSSFVLAIDKAKKGNFEESEKLIKSGNEQLILAHRVQTNLLALESRGNDLTFSIILVHAQDHMTSAIMYEKLARNFIDLYKQI